MNDGPLLRARGVSRRFGDHVALEPTAALDPRQRRRLWETARGVRDAGGAVVLVTQNLADLEHVADRVAALLDGRVVFDGPVAAYLTSEAAGSLR